MDDTGECVASQIVGAEPVRRARRRECGREIGKVGIVRRKPRCAQGRACDHRHDRRADRGARIHHHDSLILGSSIA